jgi:hypothetical protein
MRIDESGNHGAAAGVKDDTGLFRLPSHGRDPAIPDADRALRQFR